MTSNDADLAVLPSLLTTLHLPSIGRHWKRLTETADREGWPAAKLLATLAEIEVADRATPAHPAPSARVRPAGWQGTLATFDFDAAPGLRKAHVLTLATGEGWIGSGANLLVFGQSGTENRTPSPPSAAPSSMPVTVSCSPGPPTWCRNCRRRGANWPWPPPRQTR